MAGRRGVWRGAGLLLAAWLLLAAGAPLMSATAGTVWEVRPDGSQNNGGGFDASFGGTDYSQQAAAVLTVTDAACSNTTTITSLTGGFTAAMVGNYVNVNGQSVSAALFQIHSVTDANTIVVDRAAGSFSAKTLTVGGAMTITSAGYDPAAFSAMTAGNKMWVRGTNSVGVTQGYSVSDASGFATPGGTSINPCAVEGYGTVRGDGLSPTITITGGSGGGGSGHVNLGGACVTLHLKFVDARSANQIALIETASNNAVVIDVTMVGAGNNNPLYVANGSESCLFLGCLFNFSGSTSMFPFSEAGNGNVYRDCVFVGAAGAGNYALSLANFDATSFDACIIYGNSSSLGAVNLVTSGSALNNFRNCIIWNNVGDGVAITAGDLMFVGFQGCIFGKNTGYDLNSLTAGSTTGGKIYAQGLLDCNFFLTTGLGRYHNIQPSLTDTVLTVDPFNGAATGDFSLNSAVGGGAAITGGLCQTTLPGVTNVIDTQIAGPYGGVGTAGTSSSTVSMRSLWRELTNERNTQVIPDSTVDIYLDFGLQELNRRLHYHYTTAADITLVAGQQEYPMPVAAIEIVWVQYANNRLLEKGSVEQWRRLGEDWRNEPAGEPRFWAHYGSNFVIRPAPSGLAVAAAPNLTLRRKDTPPSITTNGPEQLPTEAYRPVVLYGAALWSAAYPDAVVAQQRAAYLKAEFEAAVGAMIESYARREISL